VVRTLATIHALCELKNLVNQSALPSCGHEVATYGHSVDLNAGSVESYKCASHGFPLMRRQDGVILIDRCCRTAKDVSHPRVNFLNNGRIELRLLIRSNLADTGGVVNRTPRGDIIGPRRDGGNCLRALPLNLSEDLVACPRDKHRPSDMPEAPRRDPFDSDATGSISVRLHSKTLGLGASNCRIQAT
jgi:hypothetical protein